MPKLKDVRKDLALTLTNHGIKTVSLFGTKDIRPPVNIITPTDDYIRYKTNAKMNMWNVQLSVVVVSGGLSEANADEVDDLIEATIMAVADPNAAFWTIDAVSGPQKIKFEGQSKEYYCGVVILSTETTLDNI